ncbi:unnamed protein product [Mytilus edulis]|uniref:Uncharacterized protein n=1 Tax=Mytilus edulis TaxID=6550 RepID=A0A8S3SID2_MYTED|nr:unnamed protein product [Mytilus edulis]
MTNDPEIEIESKPDCVILLLNKKDLLIIPRRLNDQKEKAQSETARETLSENDRKHFMERIQFGHEVRKYVRIQVIGKDGVGKTSLVRRLLNQDLEGVTSTDGIDISRKFHIKEDDGTWIFDNDQTEMEKIGNRILYAVQLQQMDNETNNGERLIADLNSSETEKMKHQNMT